MEGTRLCRALRQSGCTAQPIVLLTAGPGDPQTDEAYLSGADDCVPRSTSARQLAVRLQAIRRRSQTHGARTPASVMVGDLTVDTEAHLARWRGTVTALSRTELRLLYILALNAGQIISTDRLIEYGLGSDLVGRLPRGRALLLAAHVARIRRKLALPARGAGAIVAQTGLGYRLEGPGHTMARRPAAIAGPSLAWHPPLAS
jgi:DNA-binding response OmpR family regulator